MDRTRESLEVSSFFFPPVGSVSGINRKILFRCTTSDFYSFGIESLIRVKVVFFLFTTFSVPPSISKRKKDHPRFEFVLDSSSHTLV